jgi:lipid-A-disaccharide synthase
VRYFFSTGEPSGETSALLLAREIARLDPQAQFEGIGAQRMRDAGFALWRDHTGWASMGPLAAIPRIPKLLATMWRTALHLASRPPDLLVLVDFGVFNLRLASALRGALRYRGPIVDVFPPGTWLDDPHKARRVSALTVPVTAFEHQSAFYRRNGLRIEFFGHPLAGEYAARPPRAAPEPSGGTVAILPGSRGGELRRHLPVLAEAYRKLRELRPHLRGVFGAADARGEAQIGAAIARYALENVSVVRGVPAAIAGADAAWVASGTAVLECALGGVPLVALYVISPILVEQGRKMIKHGFITLPNLVLGRAVVPELLQEQATPERLVAEMQRVLLDPSQQYASFVELRTALGPSDALQRCARFAVDLAAKGAPPA